MFDDFVASVFFDLHDYIVIMILPNVHVCIVAFDAAESNETVYD